MILKNLLSAFPAAGAVCELQTLFSVFLLPVASQRHLGVYFARQTFPDADLLARPCLRFLPRIFGSK